MKLSKTPLEQLSIEQKSEIVYGGITEYTGSSDVVVVLGGKPENVHPRVLRAAELYHDGKADRILVSGGVKWKTDHGEESEAEYMRRILLEHGVPEEKILLENQARNTNENLLFAAVQILRLKLTAPLPVISVLTSGYHIRRSMGLAKIFLPRIWKVCPILSHTPHDNAAEWANDPAMEEKVERDLFFLKRDVDRKWHEEIEF